MFLKQSTSQIIRFGPFLDSTDGVTAETALTIAQADMQLSKDGAAFAQKNTTGNATHDTDGWYSTTLDTTDTATVGELYMQVNVSGSLPVWVRYWVTEEAVYDDFYAASAPGYLKPTVAARTLDVTATGTAGIDWANVENQGTTVDLSATDINLVDTTTANTDMRGTDSAALASSLPANFGDMSIAITTGLVDITQAAADKAWGTAARTLTAATNITSDASAITMSSSGVVGTVNLVNTLTTYTGNTPQTGDNFARIGVNGAGLSNINLPNQTMDIIGDITGNLSGSVGSVTGSVTIDGTSVDLIWDETLTAHVTADSAAVHLKDILEDTNELQTDDVPGLIGALENVSLAGVKTQMTDALNVDTYAMPGQGAMPATTTIVTQLGYLFKFKRNKSDQTASLFQLYADDTTTVDQKATVSDDTTTFTREEIVTGP